MQLSTVGHVGGPLPGASRPRPDRPGWERLKLDLGGRLVLGHTTPAVTLPRIVSGIGTLTVEAAIATSVGPVTLSCAYELDNEPVPGTPTPPALTSLLTTDGTNRIAPTGSKRPVLLSGRRQFDQVSVDLRQVRSVHRLLFVLAGAPGVAVTWAGTLVVETHGSARAEIPLDGLGTSTAGAALAIYQVDGELVLRAELEPAASVRDACLAFGYDRITWLDDHTVLG